MISLTNYRLIDFGLGRKLEAFGDYWIDRPSPAAAYVGKSQPGLWAKAHASFDDHGWEFETPVPDAWHLDCGPFVLPLSLRPYGHVGAFPEQAPNWEWLRQQAIQKSSESHPIPKALNLFAYTGGSTLSLASAGVAVAHVDAARPNLMAARTAAIASHMQDAPIRYLHDDALAFARREVRRNQHYDFFVLDPPAYGHGPKGNAWRLERDLWPLLEVLTQLANPYQEACWLITGHSESIQPPDIEAWFHANERGEVQVFESGDMELSTSEGEPLNAGWFTRCICRFKP